MQYYTLTLLINDRREIVIPLSNTTAAADTPYRYIIEVPQASDFFLFEIDKHAQLKAFFQNGKDYAFQNFESDFDVADAQTLKLSFLQRQDVQQHTQEEEIELAKAPRLTYDDLDNYEPSVNSKHTKTATKVQHISLGTYAQCIQLNAYHYSNGALCLTGNDSTQNAQTNEIDIPDLKIVLEATLDGQVYRNEIIFTFCYPDQFLGLALDFGSESSQMAVKRSHKNHILFQEKKPEIVNLYKNIISYHKARQWIDLNDQSSYYQEEPGTNFYKSIFFLKENLSGNYTDITESQFIEEQEKNLKMLVNTRDGYSKLSENKYYQLPNLKITHKYDEIFSSISFVIDRAYGINVSLGEMKNKIYNSILKVLIESYLKQEFTKYAQAKRKIRFILLVPNIYDQIDIQLTQYSLNSIFRELSEQEYQGRLLAWEIITISESDASFLGYINKNDVDIETEKDYIIIDSGKGTTDFSVLRTGKSNVFNIMPVYRNGFAGAGNMITFAVFETLIHYIRAHSENSTAAIRFVREQLLKIFTDNDLERKNKFYNELERLKFNFKTNTEPVLPQWEQAQSGDTTFSNIATIGANIDVLSNLLSKIENIGDFYGYIADTCTLIAQRVVSNLKMIKDNKKDFDCGAVILTGRAFLFKPLVAEIKKCIQEQLRIPENKIHILSGYELKDVCMKGVFNNSVRINSEKIGYPIQIVQQSDNNIEDVVTRQEKEKSKKLTSRLLRIFFNELNAIENAEAILANDDKINYNSLFKSQIMIGPKRYKVKGATMYDQGTEAGTEADIIYTPNSYLVRKKVANTVKNIFPLSEIFDNSNTENNMIIPSLFPNYIEEKYIYSLNRDDIQKAANPNLTQQANVGAAPVTPKDGPIYF